MPSSLLSIVLLVACAAPVDGTETPPRFVLPVESASPLLSPALGVDHDPVGQPEGREHQCIDHDGRSYPFCLDGHEGTDFRIPKPASGGTVGPWAVAGAAGEVVSLGPDPDHPCLPEEELCQGTVSGIDRLVLRHRAGFSSITSHLESGSILVEIGQEVKQGQRLGRPGGGTSHQDVRVHFAVFDPEGQLVDPFLGTHSRPEGDSLGSLWCEQEAEDGFPASDCAY